MSDRDFRDAIEETRVVSALRAQERFDDLNPFIEGQLYTIIVEVKDRNNLWEFVGRNLYAGKNEIPGAKLVGVSRDPKSVLDEVLNSMEDILRKCGRI